MTLNLRKTYSAWVVGIVIASGLAAVFVLSPGARAAVHFQDSFDPVPQPGWMVGGVGWHLADDSADPCFGSPQANHPANSASSPNSFAYHFDTAPPATPGKVCTYSMDDGAGGSAANSGILISPAIDLSTSGPFVRLRFSTWRQTEGDPSFDRMTISLDTGSGPFQVFQLLDPLVLQSAWDTIDVDISAGVGFPAVTIVFGFDSLDGVSNQFAGWYLDNVSVATPGLDLLPDLTSGGGARGATQVYPFTIDNLQPVPDTFDLTSTGVLGWTVEFWDAADTALLTNTGGSLAPDTGIVGPGATFSFNVHVLIPGAANPGDMETSTITAASAANPVDADVSTVTTLAAYDPPFLDAFDPFPRLGWTLTDNGAGTRWEWGTPYWGPGGCSSSPSCYGTNLNSDYTNNALVDLISPPVSLPAGLVASLEFRHWYVTESCCDPATVWASSDHASWTFLGQYQGTSGGWRSVQLDLSAFSGGLVYVRFRLTTDSSVIRAGWYLDDFSVTAPALDLLPDSTSGNGPAGTTQVYPFTIDNLQPVPDTFDLTSTGVLGWTVEFWDAADTALLTNTGGSLAPDTGIVGPGATFGFNVHVLIPGAANPGDAETSTMTAASAATPTNTDLATVVTLVPYVLPFFDAFDPSPRLGWTVADNGAGTIWEWGATSWGPGSCYSLPSCYGTNLNSDYTNNAVVDLISPPVSLPAGSPATLEFRHWHALEFCCDPATVWASSDGVSWSLLNQYRGTSGGWQAAQFDLSAFSGGLGYVRFRLTTDGSVIYAGWYLDDVRVTSPALDLLPDSTSGTGVRGTTRVYPFTIDNLQTIPDTFDLTASGILGWTVEFWNAADTGLLTDTGGSPAPDTGVVGPGATFSFNVHVLIPGTANPGNMETSTITATPVANSTTSDVSIATTTAVAALELLPTSVAGAGQAGTAVVYPFSVRNLQATADTFDLTATGIVGWSVQFWNAADTALLTNTGGSPAPDTGPVTPGATFLFNVRVNIPPGAAVGSSERSTITATSAASPANWDASMVTTVVPVVPDWFDALETGPAPWINATSGGIDEWEWGTPTIVGPPSCFSGTRCWGTDLDGTYDPGFDASLYPPSFDLTSSIRVNLSFRHWFEIYADNPPSSADDGGFLEITTDGLTWNHLMVTSDFVYNDVLDSAGPYSNPPAFAGASAGWVLSTVNLTAYAGSVIQIRFRLWQDLAEGHPTLAGWYIDDVHLDSVYTEMLLVTVTSQAPPVAGTDQFAPMMRIDLDNDAADDGLIRVTGISLNLTGCSGASCANPSRDADVRGVLLVQDRGDGAYDALDPLRGFATFSSRRLTFVPFSPLWITANGTRLFVVYWVAATAVVGDYIGASVSATDITVSAPDAVGAFAGVDTYLPGTRSRIATQNLRPTANAGPDQIVSKRTSVTLDGQQSTDPDNDSLTFAWSAPSGIALSATNVASPTFTPARGGSYTFSLMVLDGRGGTATDTATIVVTNAAPVAEAGANQTIGVGSQGTLDGSDSSDPTGDALTFAWTVPAGITLSSATSASPTFTLDTAGTFTLSLTVTDEEGLTNTDTVTITVPGGPGGGGAQVLGDLAWLLIVFIVLAVAFVLGILFGRRMRTKPQALPQEAVPPPPPQELTQSAQEPSTPRTEQFPSETRPPEEFPSETRSPEEFPSETPPPG